MGALYARAWLPQPGDVIGGKYRVERVLGQGGMGAVFAAENTLTGRRVAIKWLLPERARNAEARSRLLREARATATVRHENVVEILDVSEHEDALFLIMEYLDGPPLSKVVQEGQQANVVETVNTLIPAMRGVHAAHKVGVIHRDLKPDNIILVTNAHGQIVPKVVDFGVSKVLGPEVDHTSLTHTGAMLGTPRFMALEQVDGSGGVDARTDVYAFGVMLYLALSGRPPHQGSSIGEIVLKIGTKTPTPLRKLRPDLPEELERVVMKALAREKEHRFGGVDQLAMALEPFGTVSFRVDPTGPLVGLSTTTRPVTPAYRPVPQARSGAKVATFVLAGCVALGGLGFFARAALHEPSRPSASFVPPLPVRPTSAVIAPKAEGPKQEPTATTVHAASADESAKEPPSTPVAATLSADPAPAKLVRRAAKPRPAKTTSAEPASDVTPVQHATGKRTKGLSASDF